MTKLARNEENEVAAAIEQMVTITAMEEMTLALIATLGHLDGRLKKKVEAAIQRGESALSLLSE